MKILIIEDERELSDNIVTFLSSENYLCEQAFTFADARMKVHLYEYECIVLDIMLPDGNGLELLKEIRDRHSQVGVIIVSAKDSINTPIRDKIAISCMLRQIHEFSSHAIRHGLYIKNRKRLFCP